MRKLFFSLMLGTLCLSGCAVEDLSPDEIRTPSLPTLPSQQDKPTKQQRRAIMSGERPDWREHSLSIPRDLKKNPRL